MDAPRLHTSIAAASAGNAAPANFSPENRLATKAAADYLGIRPETLARWRSERRPLGSGQPDFYRAGRKIFYLKRDLDLFLRNRSEAIRAAERARHPNRHRA